MGKWKNAMNNVSARKRSVGLWTFSVRTAGAQPFFLEPLGGVRAGWTPAVLRCRDFSVTSSQQKGAWVCARENLQAPQR